MKRLIPRSRASVARPIARAPAVRWRPAVSDSLVTTHGTAHISTTPRCLDSSTKASFSPSAQAQPRGAYYDVLITSPPPYSNAKANEPPVTAQPRPKAPAVAGVESPKTTPPPPPPPPPRKATPPPETKTAAPPATETPEAAQSASTFTPSEAPAAVHAAKLAAERAAAKEAKKEEAAARARIVFGSRLAGPMERENRLAEIRKRSRRVAGVILPPKPSEPDNCCMSGCVNCVWDRFRDEMEEWAAANVEVQRRLAAGHQADGSTSAAPASEAGGASPISMDDDGGGSNTNWNFDEAVRATGGASGTDANWEDEIYKGVPVGIREFMKQEKRLKMKHMQEGTMGG
ncbi:oxidoreductase-like protein [Ophiostoma piceae UAMH 11346]|uniref:Oxidoreductase-like protein n=1 Tax=Ophiostoma piceae (strain UAMH 11346) TaxID=1262450 RepID=S3C2E9_OPHP1|nr:oxidoreductase-like protein [Ophiostoma piceae UAMH 11346]